MARRALVTVLVGGYETLLPQSDSSASAMDRICPTDDPELVSTEWEVRQFPRHLPADSGRSARRFKLLLHEYLPDYTETLYIDNTIQLQVPPEEVFDALLDDGAAMALLRHSWRGLVSDEFDEVLMLRLDATWRCEEQRDHYLSVDPDCLDVPTLWTGMLLRRHHDPQLRMLMERWWEHVCRYSRRDQLSLPVLLRSWSAAVRVHSIDNHESPLHHWPRWADGSTRRHLPQWDGPGVRESALVEELAAVREGLAERVAEAQAAAQARAAAEADAAALAHAHAIGLQAASDRAESAESRLAQETARVDTLEVRLASMAHHAAHLEAQAERTQEAVEALIAAERAARAELDALRHSTSWRLTGPVRGVSGALRRPARSTENGTGDPATS